MAILIDTSVLGRLANVADASHATAAAAIAELHRRGEVLHITSQNLVEFRNFATRPLSANGLGLVATAAEGLAATFVAAFPLLEETQTSTPHGRSWWRQLVCLASKSTMLALLPCATCIK